MDSSRCIQWQQHTECFQDEKQGLEKPGYGPYWCGSSGGEAAPPGWRASTIVGHLVHAKVQVYVLFHIRLGVVSNWIKQDPIDLCYNIQYT